MHSLTQLDKHGKQRVSPPDKHLVRAASIDAVFKNEIVTAIPFPPLPLVFF